MKKIIIISMMLSQLAFASLQIPSQLSESDRISVLQILGLGSTYKQLADPYPLGGYSGLELGVSTEILSTEDISKLGARSQTQTETSYYLLSVGKGLYNDIDVYIQFSPPGQQENLSYFGGQLKWGFFQAEYLPFHLSLAAHANSLNLQNLLVTSTQGFDVIAGFSVKDVTLYMGGGYIKTQGTFLGGTGGLVVGDDPITETLADSRFSAGVAMRFSNFFIAAQLDRVTKPVYSAKLGLRL